MTPERWVRVREVFEAALQEPAERRSTFLARACAGDRELQAEAGGGQACGYGSILVATQDPRKRGVR